MAKTLFYAVRNEHGLYLQGIEANENYSYTGQAPTMGNRHTPTEFKTVWRNTVKTFEPLTLANYIKVLLEEYRSSKLGKFTFETPEMLKEMSQ